MKIKLIFFLVFLLSFKLHAQNNLMVKAKIAIANKDFEMAEKHLEKFLLDYPANKQALFLLAKSNIELNHYNEAVKNLDKLKVTYHDDVILFEARANAGLGKPEIALIQIDNYLKSNKKIPEKEIFNIKEFESLKKLPRWKAIWENDRYSTKEEMLINVEYAIKTGKIDEANERLDIFLSKYKRSSKAYYLKAELLYKAEEFKEALSSINEAIELDIKEINYLLTKANCLMKLNRSKKAIQAYNEILEKDSSVIEANLGRAEAHLNDSKFEQAENDINLYRSYYPQDSYAKALHAKINVESGDYLGAISKYGKLIKTHPSKEDYFIGRANSYMETKTYEYAIKDYAMALDLNPKNIEIYKKKALAHKMLGEIDKACTEWKNAAKLGDVDSMDMLYKYCK